MRVNQKQLSEIFGVSTRTIRDWDAAGCPSFTNSKTKEYEPAEVIRWRIDKAIAEDSPTVADDEEVKQALRVQAIAKADSAQADAEMKYIELAKKRGDVVVRERVEELISDAMGEVSQTLDVLPLRYPSQLAACDNELEMREVLRRAVFEIRTAISKINMHAQEEEKEDAEGQEQVQELAE